jgi:hypothetical protein
MSRQWLEPEGLSLRADEGISLEAALWSTKLNGMLQPPKISKQDDDFLSMGVEFVESSDGIVISQLNDLFEKVRSRV